MRRQTALSALLAASLLLLGAGISSAQSGLVIQNARIVTGTGQVIDRGAILITGDRIAAVGDTVEAPPGHIVIDGAGLTVYPGLIDAFCLAGVAAPPAAPAPAPESARPAGQRGRQAQGGPPARPPAPLVWRKATEGFNAKAPALAAMRNAGYTAALFGTRGVLTPGENVLLSLSPESAAAPLQDRLAVNVNTLSRGGGAYPGTLMGALAFLRQSLYDGIDYLNRKPEKADPRLEALGRAARGELPLFYAAQTENDIKRAARLGREFGARLIVLGGRDSEKAVHQLLERKTPVVLTDDWSPAVALHRAGIPFALASGKIEMSAADAEELRAKRIALREKGLPEEAILAALTRTPAELLGIGDRFGAIAPGRIANLVISDGDLCQKEAKVRFVVIQGQKLEPAPVSADEPRRTPVAADGSPYANVSEDDADRHGGDDE